MARGRGSSHRWRERQQRDPYVERAARAGWRARAAFKLEEIDRRERLLRRGMVCVDLGAAPGSFSQYAAHRVGTGGAVIAIDLLPMEAIPGVEIVQADFTSPAGLERLHDLLQGRPVDLVMSDMAPNISGVAAVDQPRSIGLAEDALAFAEQVLKPKGDFLVKMFQGEGFLEFVTQVRSKFGKARLVKPKASRAESREIYLLARLYGMV
jgi:23S rRNA (uridine2552-2'-O)-methyltransferase